MQQNSWQRLLKQIAGPHPRVSDSADLEWGLRTCISNKLLGYAAGGGGPEPIFRATYLGPCNSKCGPWTSSNRSPRSSTEKPNLRPHPDSIRVLYSYKTPGYSLLHKILIHTVLEQKCREWR
ncbi:hypothetical protein VULLAG_LOCUS20092 [Vulpes lagopus]